LPSSSSPMVVSASEDATSVTVLDEAPAKKMTSTTKAHLSETSFESLVNISPAAKRALIEHMGFSKMTIVQEMTLPPILQGKDVLAKAKTGTGKTVAFLLGTLDRLVADRTSNRRQIRALVISPTRELACQIENEAKDLLKFQPPNSVNVLCVYGGVNISKDMRSLNSGPPVDVLVATPGRLEDHLANTPGFRERLKGIQFLIMDEADQLLEMGFRPAIERIVQLLPKDRQTLCFSATVPPTMHKFAPLVLKPGHSFIDTVGEDAGSQTHESVTQEVLVAPLEEQIRVLDALIQEQVCCCFSLPFHSCIFYFIPLTPRSLCALFCFVADCQRQGQKDRL